MKKIKLQHQNLVLAKLEEIMSDKPKKGFNAKIFTGKLKVNEDAMVIQKRLRDEWN